MFTYYSLCFLYYPQSTLLCMEFSLPLSPQCLPIIHYVFCITPKVLCYVWSSPYLCPLNVYLLFTMFSVLPPKYFVMYGVLLTSVPSMFTYYSLCFLYYPQSTLLCMEFSLPLSPQCLPIIHYVFCITPKVLCYVWSSPYLCPLNVYLLFTMFSVLPPKYFVMYG